MKLPALALIAIALLTAAACALSPGPAATIPPATMAPATARPQPTQQTRPRGLLSGGAVALEGWAGSYCWQGTCADVGSIPAKGALPQLDVGSVELAFSLSDDATFVRWTASYGQSSDDGLVGLAEGGEPFDPDAMPQSTPLEIDSAEFEAPPAGDWTLFVTVQFPGGDLSYAWRVIVS